MTKEISKTLDGLIERGEKFTYENVVVKEKNIGEYNTQEYLIWEAELSNIIEEEDFGDSVSSLYSEGRNIKYLGDINHSAALDKNGIIEVKKNLFQKRQDYFMASLKAAKNISK